ncbi:MAG: hypothetical protein PHV32_15625 [Eubacteriales bacterium]|nr:hypothetical protein [Eubacteriales bacterium]
MSEIIKVYKQSLGAMRFIGKKYGDGDRINGNFGAKWSEWHSNGWFGIIEKQINSSLKDVYEDGDAYIGLMRRGHDTPFEYWIGIFMPEGTPVPNGFASIDFPARNLGVCWIYGNENEVYMLEGECGDRLGKEGFDVDTEWCFERYTCPRFTTSDDKGKIILDLCFFLK